MLTNFTIFSFSPIDSRANIMQALIREWFPENARAGKNMIALAVSQVGSFMSKLLSSDCFDSFLLEEASIRMAVTYQISGHLNKDFFDTDVWNDPAQRPYDLAPWSSMRGRCRDLVKGKRVPASMRITLQLKPEYTEATIREGGGSESLAESVEALALNIRLENGHLIMTTGVSLRTFSMDRSADRIWDEATRRFLRAKGIEFEEDM